MSAGAGAREGRVELGKGAGEGAERAARSPAGGPPHPRPALQALEQRQRSVAWSLKVAGGLCLTQLVRLVCFTARDVLSD